MGGWMRLLPDQAPAVPGADQLKDLSPPVAIALLVVVGIAVIGFYFGPALRDRLKPPDTPAPPPQVVSPPVAAPATDAANSLATQYIEELRARNRELTGEMQRQGREIKQLRDEVERLRIELERERWRHR